MNSANMPELPEMIGAYHSPVYLGAPKPHQAPVLELKGMRMQIFNPAVWRSRDVRRCRLSQRVAAS